MIPGLKSSRDREIDFQGHRGLWFASRPHVINGHITWESSLLLTLILVIFNYAFGGPLYFFLVLIQPFKLSVMTPT